MKLRFEHVAITVSDMKKSLAFYRDILGFEVMGQLTLRDGFLIVYLKNEEGPIIELFEFAEKGEHIPENRHDRNYGFKHLCFRVDDVNAYSEYLKGHGVTFIEGPRYDEKAQIHLAFFLDPDNNKLEITSAAAVMEQYKE